VYSFTNWLAKYKIPLEMVRAKICTLFRMPVITHLLLTKDIMKIFYVLAPTNAIGRDTQLHIAMHHVGRRTSHEASCWYNMRDSAPDPPPAPPDSSEAPIRQFFIIRSVIKPRLYSSKLSAYFTSILRTSARCPS